MMSKRLQYIALGFALMGLTACRQDVPGMEPADEEAGRIYLSAGVGRTVSTRAPYTGEPTQVDGVEVPTMSHPLNVSVWASTDEEGTFPNEGKNGSDGTVAIHTEAHFQSGDPQLLGEAIYPKSQGGVSKTVYFVGLHPKSGQYSASWTSTDNKSASYTFTGKEDVMFAPRISGTYGTAYEQSPTFHFYHLLTWLRIEMVADKDEADVMKREDVSTAWGKITSLTLMNTKNEVTIGGLGQAPGDDYASYVTFVPDDASIDGFHLYYTGTDDEFPSAEGYEIPVNRTEVAYVMCAPVTGKVSVWDEEIQDSVPAPEYTLHIETEERTLDIPIDLKGDSGDFFRDNTMGRMFTILLNFKMGNVISVSTEISVGGDTDWFTHGTGSGDLKEDHLIDISVND